MRLVIRKNLKAIIVLEASKVVSGRLALGVVNVDAGERSHLFSLIETMDLFVGLVRSSFFCRRRYLRRCVLLSLTLLFSLFPPSTGNDITSGCTGHVTDKSRTQRVVSLSTRLKRA